MVARQPALHGLYTARAYKLLRRCLQYSLHLPGGIAREQPWWLCELSQHLEESVDDRIQHSHTGLHAVPCRDMVLSNRPGPADEIWQVDQQPGSILDHQHCATCRYFR